MRSLGSHSLVLRRVTKVELAISRNACGRPTQGAIRFEPELAIGCRLLMGGPSVGRAVLCARCRHDDLFLRLLWPMPHHRWAHAATGSPELGLTALTSFLIVLMLARVDYDGERHAVSDTRLLLP